MMNKLLMLFFLAFIVLVSCDGRDRAKKSNTDVLKEHKLLDSFSESIRHFPETYTETITDTILSNGYKVKIKNFTDMENSYLDEFKQDSILYKHYYRDSKANISVTNNTVVFNELIDKTFFLNFDNSLSTFFNKANLDGVWLNEEKTLSNSKITIDVVFCKPESDICEFFNLMIDENGKYEIVNVTEEEGN